MKKKNKKLNINDFNGINNPEPSSFPFTNNFYPTPITYFTPVNYNIPLLPYKSSQDDKKQHDIYKIPENEKEINDKESTKEDRENDKLTNEINNSKNFQEEDEEINDKSNKKKLEPRDETKNKLINEIKNFDKVAEEQELQNENYIEEEYLKLIDSKNYSKNYDNEIPNISFQDNELKSIISEAVNRDKMSRNKYKDRENRYIQLINNYQFLKTLQSNSFERIKKKFENLTKLFNLTCELDPDSLLSHYTEIDRKMYWLPRYITSLPPNTVKIAAESFSKIVSSLGHNIIYVDRNNQCLLFEQYNIKRCVSYSNFPRRTRILYGNKICVDEILGNYFKNNNIKNYKIIQNNNPHIFLEGVRAYSEDYMVKLLDPDITHIGIGHNLQRMEDIGGVYFSKAINGSDQRRIEKYRRLTRLSDQLIINEIFNFTKIEDINRPFQVSMTDVIYYIPNYFEDLLSNEKVRDYHGKTLNCFNIFTKVPGTYEIYPKCTIEVSYQTVKYQDGKFELSIVEDKQIFQKINEDNINTFIELIEGKYYIIPYVKMEVEGNPRPYEHAFPCFNGHFICVENLDVITYPNGQKYDVTHELEFIIPIHKRMKYIVVSSFTQINEANALVTFNLKYNNENTILDRREIPEQEIKNIIYENVVIPDNVEKFMINKTEEINTDINKNKNDNDEKINEMNNNIHVIMNKLNEDNQTLILNKQNNKNVPNYSDLTQEENKKIKNKLIGSNKKYMENKYIQEAKKGLKEMNMPVIEENEEEVKLIKEEMQQKKKQQEKIIEEDKNKSVIDSDYISEKNIDVDLLDKPILPYRLTSSKYSDWSRMEKECVNKDFFIKDEQYGFIQGFFIKIDRKSTKWNENELTLNQDAVQLYIKTKHFSECLGLFRSLKITTELVWANTNTINNLGTKHHWEPEMDFNRANMIARAAAYVAMKLQKETEIEINNLMETLDNMNIYDRVYRTVQNLRNKYKLVHTLTSGGYDMLSEIASIKNLDELHNYYMLQNHAITNWIKYIYSYYWSVILWFIILIKSFIRLFTNNFFYTKTQLMYEYVMNSWDLLICDFNPCYNAASIMINYYDLKKENLKDFIRSIIGKMLGIDGENPLLKFSTTSAKMDSLVEELYGRFKDFKIEDYKVLKRTKLHKMRNLNILFFTLVFIYKIYGFLMSFIGVKAEIITINGVEYNYTDQINEFTYRNNVTNTTIIDTDYLYRTVFQDIRIVINMMICLILFINLLYKKYESYHEICLRNIGINFAQALPVIGGWFTYLNRWKYKSKVSKSYIIIFISSIIYLIININAKLEYSKIIQIETLKQLYNLKQTEFMENYSIYIYSILLFIIFMVLGIAYYEIIEDKEYKNNSLVRKCVDNFNWMYDHIPIEYWGVRQREYYYNHKIIKNRTFPFIIFTWSFAIILIYSKDIYRLIKCIQAYIGYKIMGKSITMALCKVLLVDRIRDYWYVYLAMFGILFSIGWIYVRITYPFSELASICTEAMFKTSKAIKIFMKSFILTLVALNLGFVIYSIIRFNQEFNTLKWETFELNETWRYIIIILPNIILPIITLISRILWLFNSKYSLVFSLLSILLRTFKNHMIEDVYTDIAIEYAAWIKLGKLVNKTEEYIRKCESLLNLYNFSKSFFNYTLIFKSFVGCYNIHISSKCSFNDIEMMYEFLSDLKILNRIRKYNLFYKKYDFSNNSAYQHYKYIPEKYEIVRLPTKEQMECEFKPETDPEPVTNIGPQIMGKTIIYNCPYKLHKCVRNECEAVYRQVQCKIRPDPKVVKEFLIYTRSWIDEMIDQYYEKNYDLIFLSSYFSKLGSKSEEYKEALEDYNSGKTVDLRFKMHPKTDEKIVINWEEPKGKARNISAQKSIAKLLMGLLCEYGMKILHVQPWCGPGLNYDAKAEKFEEWDRKLGGIGGLLCCDGSSFDSTQHKEFIEGIDKYFLESIFERNKEKLLCYFNLTDIHDIISQTEFEIYSRHFTFKIQGTQLSGRMNTCLSNTIRSAAYIKFIIHKMEDKLKVKLEFVVIFFEVTGDDQLIMTPEFLKKLYEFFAYKYVYSNKDISQRHGLGQICKIFDWYPNKNGAEYLSCHILYNKINGKFIMIRKIDRFFQLIPYTFKNAFKNIKKFNFMKQQLAILVSDSLINSNQSIKLYQYYGLTLKRIIESTPQLKNPFHAKTRKAYNNKIKQLEKHLKYSQHNTVVKEGFNEVFEDFLFEKYNINKQDIQEYYEALDNFKNLDDHCNLNIVDKIYSKLTTPEFIETYGKINVNGYKVIRSIQPGEKEFSEIIVRRNEFDEF